MSQPNLPPDAGELPSDSWTPAFRMPIYSETESPLKVLAARAAGREYASLLRDYRQQGQGDASFDTDAEAIEKHLDYLDDEYPAC